MATKTAQRPVKKTASTRKRTGEPIRAKRERHSHMGSPSNPQPEFLEFLGNSPARSGIEVTEQVALSQTAVFSAIRRISQNIARLPLQTYRRNDDIPLRKAREHSNYRLLHIQPNPIQTALEFWELMLANLLVRGNAYAEIVRDFSGNPTALWWHPSNRVQVMWLGDEPYYIFTYPDGKQAVFAMDRVLHVSGFGLNGLVGMNVINTMKDALGITAALEAYAASLFGNGANVGGVVTFDKPFKNDEEREKTRRIIESSYGGIDNSHRVLVLSNGAKWEQRGISPEDAQAISCRTFQIAEVARIWDMPLHMLAELTRATFTNIEHQALEFVIYTLGPIATRIEQRVLVSMFTPKEIDQGYYVRFAMDALLRGDAASRVAYYEGMFRMGALDQDEIRDKEDMAPRPNGEGSHTWMPVNYTTVELALKGPQQPIEQAPQTKDLQNAA